MRNYKIIAVVLVLALAGLRLHAADDKAKLPEAAAAIAKDAPKIDGDLDDAMWKDATELKGFKTADGDEPKVKTRVLVARDDKNVYFGIECFESAENLKKLVADVKDHDGDVWGDDSVELFIDPANHRKSWYHIVINSKNVSLDGVHEAGDDATQADLTWNPKFQSAVKVGDKSWTVEIAIPIDQFDRTATSSDTWAFNFLRNRNFGEDTKDYVYWSPISGTAHNPDKFGTLTNMPVWKDRAVAKKAGN